MEKVGLEAEAGEDILSNNYSVERWTKINRFIASLTSFHSPHTSIITIAEIAIHLLTLWWHTQHTRAFLLLFNFSVSFHAYRCCCIDGILIYIVIIWFNTQWPWKLNHFFLPPSLSLCVWLLLAFAAVFYWKVLHEKYFPPDFHVDPDASNSDLGYPIPNILVLHNPYSIYNKSYIACTICVIGIEFHLVCSSRNNIRELEKLSWNYSEIALTWNDATHVGECDASHRLQVWLHFCIHRLLCRKRWILKYQAWINALFPVFN